MAKGDYNVKLQINCINCPCMYGGICFVRPPEVDGLIADNVEELYKKGGKPDWCPMVEMEMDGDSE